ncbi:transposase [Chitinasiproducens palmae]|uniref:Transposase of IS4/5 family n=1 Tax=Chitinasiproducens palmae TaxID=1770053 RepID=A0A1H2PMD3_9BURK|nr:transposase [Chitinasiproducens palmae]SDV47611.1 Putative transposase of IS4/5 family [Chitinasiproducens palmae]
MKPYVDLTDEQWASVRTLIPELNRRIGSKGRHMRGRPLCDTRAVLNAVLWVMYSGASWASMPRRYPSYQTCHRRFKNWHECGVMKDIAKTLFGPSADAFNQLISSRMRAPIALLARAASGGAAARSAREQARRVPASHRAAVVQRAAALAGAAGRIDALAASTRRLKSVATVDTDVPAKVVKAVKPVKAPKPAKLVGAPRRAIIPKAAPVASGSLARVGVRLSGTGTGTGTRTGKGKAETRATPTSTSVRTGSRAPRAAVRRSLVTV